MKKLDSHLRQDLNKPYFVCYTSALYIPLKSEEYLCPGLSLSVLAHLTLLVPEFSW